MKGTSRRLSGTERRDDEATLYHLVDRDLQRGVLFKGCNYWGIQEKLRNGAKIDYAIRHGDYLLGIEVKQDVPRTADFNQVTRKYQKFFDGVFLAYPADYAAQALYVGSQDGEQTIGLISLAPFRSNVFRPAKLEGRKDNYLWDDKYDDGQWIQNQGEANRWELQLAKTALLEGGIWTSFDKKLGLSEGGKSVGFIRLRSREWGTLAAAYLASQVYAYLQLIPHQELWRLQKKVLRLGFPSTKKLVAARLVDELTYGRGRINTYCLSLASCNLLEDVKSALKSRLPRGGWSRLREAITSERKSLRARQDIEARVFLSRRSR